MRSKSKGSNGKGPKRLNEWIKGAKKRGANFIQKAKSGARSAKIADRIPQSLKDFDASRLSLSQVSEHSNRIRWGLLVLAVFFLAQITAGVIGLFIRPSYPRIPKRVGVRTTMKAPPSTFETIDGRNIFNVEGVIPEPFESSLLDCMSQARPSREPITLMGTVVMTDEKHSTALIQGRGGADKIAVKKGDSFFDGKYIAMKVERKKLCFQVRSTQEFEFVDIPEESTGIRTSMPQLSAPRNGGGDGIRPVSENQYEVDKSFLNDKMLNLNEILQTARAVPYIEPGSGKFRGFLVQSIDRDSPFSQLGIRQGDVLTQVNQIPLNDAGKGLTAFQELRNSNQISLKVLRGGRETTLDYNVK